MHRSSSRRALEKGCSLCHSVNTLPAYSAHRQVWAAFLIASPTNCNTLNNILSGVWQQGDTDILTATQKAFHLSSIPPVPCRTNATTHMELHAVHVCTQLPSSAVCLALFPKVEGESKQVCARCPQVDELFCLMA